MSSNLSSSKTDHASSIDETVLGNIGPSDQRKIRHLTNISIQNLSIHPRQGLYNFSSLLLHPPPTKVSQNQSTSTSKRNDKGKGKQVQNNNNNNDNNNDNRTIISGAIDDTDLYLRQQSKKSGNGGASGRKRGMSNASIGSISMSSENATMGETASSSKTDGRARSNSVISSRIKEEELGYQVPDTVLEEGEKGVTSGSRMRTASLNTVGSGSTIRAGVVFPTPTPPDQSQLGTGGIKPEEAKSNYTSSTERIRLEKERRIEIMRKRLVDSFITISLPLTPSSSTLSNTEEESSPRKRFLRSSSSSSQRPSIPRLSSSSSTSKIKSLIPHSPPFFISDPVDQKLHPSFEIDPHDFLLPADVEVEDWNGNRERRIIVEVWVRGDEGRGVELGGRKEGEEDWILLVEWDVEFDGLICLGKDPSTFPPLPPNTLLFRLSRTYYTTPTIYHIKNSFEDYSSTDSDCSSDETKGGNASDPGGEISTNLKLKRKEKMMERKQEEIRKIRESERVVLKAEREGKEAVSANLDQVCSLVKLQMEVSKVKHSVKDSYKILDKAFENENDFSTLERERNQLKDRVDDFKAVHTELVLDLGEYQEDLMIEREAIKSRRERLKLVRELAERSKLLDKEIESTLAENQILCQTIQQLTHSRRTQLITLLSHLFPIDPSPTSPSSLLFTIHSLPLPNTLPSSVSHSDSEIYSSALGYVAQLVSTLATYVAVPLCYPVKCLGSRSLVMDLISMMTGPRAFPLYGEGVERYRFDYGVFLLNKNIEQLMYSQGLIVLDLRNTLPNLKSLLLSLSYDPSHSDFQSSTLVLPTGFETHDDLIEEEQPTSLSIQVYNPSFSSSSSSSDSSSPGSDSDFYHVNRNRNRRSRPPSPPPKSPATTIRASSIKSNSSSVRTITKTTNADEKLKGNGGGVVRESVEGVGAGAGKNKGAAWSIGRLV